MELPNDFKELLVSFNAHDVEYMIVGGYALAFHGAPRFTGDLDVLVRPNIVNAKRVINALDDFGFGAVGLTDADFSEPNQVIQLGCPPVRIDILTSISGVDDEEVFLGRVPGRYGDVPVLFISKEQFIKNKRATGRKKDQADIEALDGEG